MSRFSDRYLVNDKKDNDMYQVYPVTRTAVYVY